MKNDQKTKHIQLVDAAQMAQSFPETFKVPSPAELSRLAAGDIVKVSNGDEAFWVQIVSRQDDIFLARVDNNLLFGRVTSGDLIQFHSCNVYQVWRHGNLSKTSEDGIVPSGPIREC